MPGVSKLMKNVACWITLAFVVAGCAATDQDPHVTYYYASQVTDSDPQWLKLVDAVIIEKQEEMARALWQQFECMRGVGVEQARAAGALSLETGISRTDAMERIKSAPQWVAANEECKQ